VFGLPGNKMLHADPVIVSAADACATDRALRKLVELRRYTETRYAAKSWGTSTRRVVARIEASTLGLDIRFVVTSLTDGSAERIYDTLYCPRGQAENLIKLHSAGDG
jgi:Transposase DDE domain group 1